VQYARAYELGKRKRSSLEPTDKALAKPISQVPELWSNPVIFDDWISKLDIVDVWVAKHIRDGSMPAFRSLQTCPNDGRCWPLMAPLKYF